MRNYFKLLSIFYKNTLISELEYRLQFWGNIGLSLFWLVTAALGVRVFFVHTDQIGGWSYNELLIVLGLFFTLNGYRQMILQPNLSLMSEYVRLGTLDYILTKPVNSQFLVSLRNIGVHNWGDPLLGLGLIIWSIRQADHTPSLVEIAVFVVLVLAAMVMLYSFNLIVQTFTFWLINLERLDMLVWSLLETGRFPVTFYQGWLRAVLTVVIPVAFMTTFPAQALLGRLDPRIALAAVGLAILSFIAASAFWRYALRFYSGASA